MLSPLPSIAIAIILIVSYANRHVLRELHAQLAFAMLSILLANAAALILSGYGQSGIILAFLVATYAAAIVMAMYLLCNYAFMISSRLWGRRREWIMLGITLLLVTVLTTQSLSVFWEIDEWPFPWQKDVDVLLLQLLFASTFGGILLVVALHKGAMESSGLLARLRCKILWLASSVYLAVSLVYLMPILVGIQSASIGYPAFMFAILASSFALVADNDRLVMLTAMIPGTAENTMHRKIYAAGRAATRKATEGAELHYQKMMFEFEMAIIEYILTECDGSQRKAAALLGLSEPTLCRRIMRMKNRHANARSEGFSLLRDRKTPI